MSPFFAEIAKALDEIALGDANQLREAERVRLEKEAEATRAIERTQAQEAEIRRLKEEVQSLTLEKDTLSTTLQAATAEIARVEQETRQETRQLEDSWILERALMNAEHLEEKERLQREMEVLRSRMETMEMAIEGGDQTRKRLEGELAALRREKDEMTQIASGLRVQLDSAKAEVVKERELAAKAAKSEKALEAILQNLREELQTSLSSKDTQIEVLDNALDEMKKELSQIHLSVERTAIQTQATVADLQAKLVACSQHENERRDQVFADQLKRQSNDLRIRITDPSQRSQSKGPIEPVNAAVHVLRTLNSEIFQTAASFVDGIEAIEIEPVLEDLETLAARLSPMLSRDLITSLRSAYTTFYVPNPHLLRVALQACMAYCCNRFITSWYPIHWDYGTFLQILHGRILETGKTQLADSWKSTTRALLRLTSEILPQFTAYLQENILDVLVIIGRSASNPDTEALVTQFEEKFSVIARLAIRMHILFSNAPSNLETFIAQPATAYQAKVMEDTYADDGDDDGESLNLFNPRLKQVICTSDIGLQRLAAKATEDNTVVIKPKVVLAAILSQEL